MRRFVPLVLAALALSAAPAHAELEGTIFIRFRGTLSLPCFGCPGDHADGTLTGTGDGLVDGLEWSGDVLGTIAYAEDPLACAAAGKMALHTWLGLDGHHRDIDAVRTGPVAASVLGGYVQASLRLHWTGVPACGEPLVVEVTGSID